MSADYYQIKMVAEALFKLRRPLLAQSWSWPIMEHSRSAWWRVARDHLREMETL